MGLAMLFLKQDKNEISHFLTDVPAGYKFSDLMNFVFFFGLKNGKQC